ncbi:galactose-1-phosphate uridylyltransferase [Methanoculleus taiwanensis]|uniref:Galactose-1-phosphate uridylyltransferase n=1 Tax=Methanoculleus taiwanensis TaxID=1550565 RepID=A0A498H035_9EURY|nr:galactose-1-phosphate uridylyltransferase [Methanoculleus taiwanensis]RXE55747.1 galactose-1-phosphate uridylyltransferase [Methanoculleus taiwanensis]
MFSVREIQTERGTLQYRRESLTGIRCRISPARLQRNLDTDTGICYTADGCPFCPGAIDVETPTFADGLRIRRGESVTFPNLYPYSAWHTVTVITRDHMVDHFGARQLADAFSGMVESLGRCSGYHSINWNYLPSAGASIAHPHLQGIADPMPSCLTERYLTAGHRYLKKHNRLYWDDLREQERSSGRFLFENEIFWSASPVPLGEREVRGLLPLSTLDEMESYVDPLVSGLLRIINLYRSLGTRAFNVAIFFDRSGRDRGYRAFCSVISRMNPNGLCICDSAFMERLHQEPIILTLPEALGEFFRRDAGGR